MARPKKVKDPLSEMRDAEARGELVTMPDEVERTKTQEPDLPETSEEVEEVIDSPQEFQMAVGRAQMDDQEYVVVSDRLFEMILKKHAKKNTYFTYGEPGIKVFKAGTKEQILAEEEMNAEEYHNIAVRRKSEEAQNARRKR